MQLRCVYAVHGLSSVLRAWHLILRMQSQTLRMQCQSLTLRNLNHQFPLPGLKHERTSACHQGINASSLQPRFLVDALSQSQNCNGIHGSPLRKPAHLFAAPSVSVWTRLNPDSLDGGFLRPRGRHQLCPYVSLTFLLSTSVHCAPQITLRELRDIPSTLHLVGLTVGKGLDSLSPCRQALHRDRCQQQRRGLAVAVRTHDTNEISKV